MAKNNNKNNSFESSMTDLMISLALIFMLLLASVMLKMNNQAGELTQTRNNLITELSEVLNQMQKGDTNVKEDDDDPLTLKVVLGEGEDSLKFATGKYNLTPQNAKFLNALMPKIISTLYDEKYRDAIDSIKIEGYTDDDKYMANNRNINVELSQLRALEVLNHTRKNCLTNAKEKEFFEDKASINGKGDIPKYLKYYDNGSVNKYASRRVEIKIKIKSKDEQHLSEKLKNNGAQVKRSK